VQDLEHQPEVRIFIAIDVFGPWQQPTTFLGYCDSNKIEHCLRLFKNCDIPPRLTCHARNFFCLDFLVLSGYSVDITTKCNLLIEVSISWRDFLQCRIIHPCKCSLKLLNWELRDISLMLEVMLWSLWRQHAVKAVYTRLLKTIVCKFITELQFENSVALKITC